MALQQATPVQQIIDNGAFLDDPNAEAVYYSFEKSKINFDNLWLMAQNQGYEKIFLSLSGIDTNQSEMGYIADAIERGKRVNGVWGTPFTISPAGREPLFYTATPTAMPNIGGGGGNTPSYEYRFYRVHKKGQVFGGNGGVLITSNDVSPAGSFNVGAVSDPTSSDFYINLGDIGGQDVWTVFNQGKPAPNLGDEWSVSGITLVTAIQNGNTKTWSFVGNQRLGIDEGLWGGDDISNPNYLAAQDVDFDLLSDQPTVSPDLFVTKTSLHWNNYTLATGVNRLDLSSELTSYSITAPLVGAEVGGFDASSEMYDGLVITFRNKGTNPITLLHNEGDIILWIKSEQNLVLNPNDILQFKYVDEDNRFELIGDLQGGNKPVPFGNLRILKIQANNNVNAIEAGDVVTGSMLNGNIYLAFGEYTGGNPMDVSSYDALTIDRYDL